MKVVARFFDELAGRIQDPARLQKPLDRALFPEKVQAGIDSQGYLSSRDGKLHLAIIRPLDDSDEPLVVVPFVGYVRRHAAAAVAELGQACGGGQPGTCPQGPLKLTLTGLPAIVADETTSLKRDLTLTTAVAIGGILLLFFYGFRSLRQTLLGMLPLLAGLAWTLAFVQLSFQSLNLVTSAFIVTLLGLGIDFAVHLLSRFNESRQQGLAPRQAAEAALMGAGPGILTGALTTSGAFIALAASRFMAFSQLGIITGVGLVFVLLLTLSTLPAMLILPRLGGLHVPPRRRKDPDAAPWFDLPGLVVKRRVVFVVAGLVVAAAMLLAAQRIPWSYNYMELMPAGLDSVDAMETLSRRTDFSAEVAGLVADSPDKTRRYAEKLKAMPEISRVESLVSYLPQEQEAKLALLRKLKPTLDGARRPAPEAVDRQQIAEAAQELVDALQDARFEAKRGGSEEDARLLDSPLASARGLLAALNKVPAAPATERLQTLQRQILDGIDEGLALLEKNVEARPVSAAGLLDELPRGIRSRLYSEGKYAIYAYPAKPIWDKRFLGRLVKDLRSVDPEATGFPVTHWETSNSIERGFRDASILACVALVLLLLLDFRSPRYALLALAPLAMGIAWMWGGISLLGIKYNHVNVIAFPLIIGIGVASGVHILHRYRQEGERNVATVVRFTGMAIFLSAATTMVGFGSLTLARHAGAASLGVVLLLGVGACLATAVLFLPALLALLKRDRG
jgi:hopanoid biosynthesis associated RND transporter like protein HpnN